jgi:Mce-associated membrane protein
MTRQNPRRPASSRAPVSRPRRVAGQASSPAETESVDLTKAPAEPPPVEPVETTAAEAPAQASPVEPVEPVETTAAEALEPAPEISTGSIGDGPDERVGLGALFDSRRATTVLLSLVAVLALVAGGLFAWDGLRDDDTTAKPSKQPVLLGGDDAAAGVDAAAKAAVTILTRNYQHYDDQIDAATDLMTEGFAKRFRDKADEVEPGFVDAKIDQQVRVVAQGVVHATRTEVQALLFMNYYVSKDAGDTVYTPYRVLVTVLHTDRGWLVSEIDTE